MGGIIATFKKEATKSFRLVILHPLTLPSSYFPPPPVTCQYFYLYLFTFYPATLSHIDGCPRRCIHKQQVLYERMPSFFLHQGRKKASSGANPVFGDASPRVSILCEGEVGTDEYYKSRSIDMLLWSGENPNPKPR